ncbi:probable protein, unknown function (apicoplast) [Plasmodium gallinaceum]|uniref:Open reading frame 78 n=1 Tax=Plasmodium gallinaceum TaxID=5849 RepID=H7CDY5_PLAGA|nr:probable protein, unknown function [Plasmodium gallinaceum]BAL70755.1 open reading frame 78 [Plasmodium gallinaceum]CRG98244.1 probable protein, unknown function [Plasmodium gallinaceum]
MIKYNNNLLNKILIKKIFRIIKHFNIFYYRLFIWIYIIILIFLLINKKNIYNKIIYNKYKYLINFLFIILLLNLCQKSDLN